MILDFNRLGINICTNAKISLINISYILSGVIKRGNYSGNVGTGRKRARTLVWSVSLNIKRYTNEAHRVTKYPCAKVIELNFNLKNRFWLEYQNSRLIVTIEI